MLYLGLNISYAQANYNRKECEELALSTWSEPEKWVWNRLCNEEVANFNKRYEKELLPSTSDGWSKKRLLSPMFLKDILTKEPFINNIPRIGVTIIGALYKKPIQLYYLDINFPLRILGSRFESDVDFSWLKTTEIFEIGKSAVLGKLQLISTKLEEQLYLRGGEFSEIDLRGTQVGKQLSIEHSKVKNLLNMDLIRVEDDLFLHNSKYGNVIIESGKIGGYVHISSTTTNNINMRSIVVEKGIRMKNADFKALFLSEAVVGKSVDMERSKVHDSITMNNIYIGNSLYMSDNAEFKNVHLNAAKINGDLTMMGSKFRGELNMHSLEVGGNLRLEDKATYKDIDLFGAKVGKSLIMDNSTFVGMLNMGVIKVGNTLTMKNAKFGTVDIGSAEVENNIIMDGSTFEGKLNLQNLVVGGTLYMSRLNNSPALYSSISLNGARIGNDIIMKGAVVTDAMMMDTATIERHVKFVEGSYALLDMKYTKIGGLLSTEGSMIEKFNAPYLKSGNTLYLRETFFKQPVNLVFASVASTILFNGSTITSLDLSGANIGDEVSFGLKENAVHWEGDSTLFLQNTLTKNLGGIPNAKKQKLGGFQYTALGGVSFNQDAEIVENINTQVFIDWLKKDETFQQQSYLQLAQVIKSAGYEAKGNEILYAGKERERTLADGMSWFRLTAINYTTGYGYHYFYSVFWIASMVVLGMIVLRFSGEGIRNKMPYGIAYSLDMLLPIIHLRSRHYEIDLSGYARYYFYFHIFMGYVLASFLLAGLSGITK
jgi:hypothetical protein